MTPSNKNNAVEKFIDECMRAFVRSDKKPDQWLRENLPSLILQVLEEATRDGIYFDRKDLQAQIAAEWNDPERFPNDIKITLPSSFLSTLKEMKV